MVFSTVKKAYSVLTKRPAQFISSIRSYWLFYRTRFLLKTLGTEAKLGANVRLQRLRCLVVEKPNASIIIGRDCVIYENAKIEAYGKGKIELGEGTVIGDARIYSREHIKLGARVVTSWNVFLQDFDPHPIDPKLRAQQLKSLVASFQPSFDGGGQMPSGPSLSDLGWSFPSAAIEIGDDVWLGANTTILKGAKIGAGSIVASNAVVTAGVYPAGAILAGVPAKVIKVLPV